MSTFTWIPDQGVSTETSAKVRRAQFGDGYAQRAPDGLNSVREVWSVQFTLRTKAEINAIDDFLRAAKGSTAFDWVTPKGGSGRYTCETWTPAYVHDGDCSLTATFQQEFDL